MTVTPFTKKKCEMKKLYIKNTLTRFDRARLMLANRHKVRVPFCWIGFGGYKVDPSLIGNLGGLILAATTDDEDNMIASLKEHGFKATNVSRYDVVRSLLPQKRGLIILSILCAFQFTIYFILGDHRFSPAWGFLSFACSILLVSFIIMMPKIFQRPPTLKESLSSVELLESSEVTTCAAKSKNGVAAIFSSNGLRSVGFWFVLVFSASWFFVPLVLYDSDSISYAFYLSHVPAVMLAFFAFNYRVLSYEISWILTSEHLLVYNNIMWGPTLQVPFSEVLSFHIDGERLRIKCSSREDFSVFVGNVEEGLLQAVDWSNRLLENHVREK